MNRAARIELLRRLAKTLSDSPWNEIDFILQEFGALTFDEWRGNDRSEYCLEMLRSADDGVLTELDAYLHGPTPATSEEAPWQTDDFRLFISHVHVHRAFASELKRWLRWYGVEGFVAHVDIEPSKEWQRVIEAGLYSCDAMVALLHKSFPDSKWCDQEVGFALGRRLKVVPVNVELQPYGFLGSVQSLPAFGVDAQTLAKRIAQVLLRDPRTGGRIVNPMIKALCDSGSFKQSNDTADLLAEHAPLITDDQVRLIKAAQQENTQVGKAIRVAPALDVFKVKFKVDGAPPKPAFAPFDPSEEPF